MKKVCIILPPFFKYPNRSGCAVETLVTIIGEKNNELKKIDLDVLSLNNTIKLNMMDHILFFLYRILKKILKIKCWYLDRYYYKVLKKVEREDYDYVIFEAGDVKKYKKLSETVGKEKMIYHMHHNIEMESEENRENIVRLFGKFIGVSNFVINKLQTMYQIEDKNVKVLSNCTTENEFRSISIEEKKLLRDKLKLKDDDFVVLFVGRLIEIKGIYELIQATKEINEKKIKLLILGSTFSENSKETDFSRKLKKSIQDFQENIIFTGHVSHEEIYQYYQIANIQVIPSICEEAAGLVAIEGMVSGLPIIATKSGGMMEYIDENCAKIINKDENMIENLKKSILELYDNHEKCEKMSQYGQKRALNFTMNKYYENFAKLIEEWES